MADRPARFMPRGGGGRMAPRYRDRSRTTNSLLRWQTHQRRRQTRPPRQRRVHLGQPSPEPNSKEPGQPRMLAIPRLDLKMPITAVTVDDKGAMAIPDRPTEIGWYAYGPRPGSARGSAVLGGHVDSRKYGVGPLVGLKQLRRGDEIIIKTTTGTERFRVSTVRLISKQDLDPREVFTREGEPLLQILTCGGTYRRSGGYQANVVVTARPA